MTETTTTTDTTADSSSAALTIVVFGRDDSGKPHASWFGGTETELAAKAAELMGMHVLRLAAGDHQDLVGKLAMGRVFATGKAFVPFVKADLYGALAALAGVDPSKGSNGRIKAATVDADAGTGDGAPRPAAQKSMAASDLTALVAGSVVLAKEGPDQGWFEAVVVKAKGETLVLKWRDYDQPTFPYQRRNIALLPAAPADEA